MNLTLTIDSTTSSARLHVAGDLDYATSDELVAAASRVLAEHSVLRDLHLDFVDLTFCDSAGLSGLLSIHRSCARAGVKLHLDHRPPHLDRVLEITGLLDFLTTPSAATASSRSSAPADAAGEIELG